MSTSLLICMAVSMNASAARDCKPIAMPDDADLTIEVGVQPADGDPGIGDRSLDGQQRHDGDTETDGDESLRREVVVAAEDDVGLGADSLERAGGADGARIADRHRDHAHAVEFGEVDGVVLGERMIGRADQHLRIADQLDHRVRVDRARRRRRTPGRPARCGSDLRRW